MIQPKKLKVVVCLDGGGTKGLMTLQMLSHLEKELGFDMTKTCDLIGGTSTGGIISFCKLINLSNEEIVDLYKKIGKEVLKFACTNITESQSIVNTKLYTDSLTKYFGDTHIKDFCAGRKCFLMTSVSEKLVPNYKPFMLSNYDNPGRAHVGPKETLKNLSVVNCVRATSGIPGLFALPTHESQIFMDGGYFHNNPIEATYHEALSVFGASEAEYIIFISFGTGECPNAINSFISNGVMNPLEKLSSFSPFKIDSPAQRIVNFMTKSSNETHLKFKAANPKVKYFRFDPILDKNIQVNDCSDETIAYMNKVTEAYLSSFEVKNSISQLKELLKQ
ncbi:hypothetical protein CYY_004137 [Polysphondylium violaceum]|uniref:PNPLA domain-containing protein n=1 Tax=Polysphondylium violaceum TaxID=133409 RepID=A0A8J4PXG4_9MYCE|nr:hypothetical protein CYY_004137 [Polysphondylium violaceum]